MEIIAWLVLVVAFLGVFCPLLALVVSSGKNLKDGYLVHVSVGLVLSIIILVLIVALAGIGLILKWATVTVGL